VRKVIIACLLSVLYLNAAPVFSEPVTGYNSYIQLLPGGRTNQANNFNVISEAQTAVTKLEYIKRGREIKFIAPKEIDVISDKYIVITYSIAYKPKRNSKYSSDPAIFVLLFTKDQNNGLKDYAGYLKWIGSKDIESFNKSSLDDICSFFRKTGASDCFYQGEKKREISSTEIAVAPVEMNELQNSLVKKEDFENVLKNISEKTSHQAKTDDSRFQELSDRLTSLENADTKSRTALKSNTSLLDTSISKIEERLATLESRNAGLVSQIDKLSDSSSKPQDIESPLTRKLSTEIEKLKQQNKELKNLLVSITSLLNGVSRKGKTIEFSGINVLINNGEGTNDVENGKGNLIVGYGNTEDIQDSHAIIAPQPVATKDYPESGFLSKLPCFIANILDY
jgi:uncharacterized coiled-coil protein SlyX